MDGLYGLKEFLKTGTEDDEFHQTENQEARCHLLFSLERTRASSVAHSLMTIKGYTIGSKSTDDSRDHGSGYMHITQQRSSFLSMKIGRVTLHESRIVFEENL